MIDSVALNWAQNRNFRSDFVILACVFAPSAPIESRFLASEGPLLSSEAAIEARYSLISNDIRN